MLVHIHTYYIYIYSYVSGPDYRAEIEGWDIAAEMPPPLQLLPKIRPRRSTAAAAAASTKRLSTLTSGAKCPKRSFFSEFDMMENCVVCQDRLGTKRRES